MSAFKIFIRRELAKPDLENKFKKWQTGQLAKIYPAPEKDQTLKQYVDANYKTYKTYQFKGLCDIQLVSRHKFKLILFKKSKSLGSENTFVLAFPPKYQASTGSHCGNKLIE